MTVVILKLVDLLWCWVERWCGVQREVGHLGKWTIVTGGTDGIGRAMATHAFKQGQNVLLIGRSNTKLAATKKELLALREVLDGCGESVDTILQDLNDLTDKDLDRLDSAFKEKANSGGIAMLVNSAGISYESATFFEDLSADRLQAVINLNLTSTIRITQKVYQHMKIAHEQNIASGGIIICLGSGSATLPSDPLYCVYSASKAGVASFCEGLRIEAQKSNILVQCHAPLMVPSKLSKAREGTIVPSMEAYVNDAWNHISCQLLPPKDLPALGSSLCTPSLVHKVIVVAAYLMPNWLWNKIRLNQNLAVRERYLKKLEQKKPK